jgi:spermidine dehydrogenase
VTIGDHRCAQTPEEPTVLHLVRTPCAPGKPRKEQHRLGRAELLATTFEQFEREIRSQLGRTLADGGFDPARDIEAITVNRWPHGYTYNYNTLSDPVEWCLASPEDRACVVGRKQFGRISIANADAAGSSHTDAAIDMAHRAIGEVVDARAQQHLSHLKPSSV